jgi:hypothetical protein
METWNERSAEAIKLAKAADEEGRYSAARHHWRYVEQVERAIESICRFHGWPFLLTSVRP